MEKERLLEITGDVENKSNKDLISALTLLSEEFEKTKVLIIDLTRHMEIVETLYDKVNNEINKRIKK